MPRLSAALTTIVLAMVALAVPPATTTATAAELEPVTFRPSPVTLQAGGTATFEGRFPGAAKREVWLQFEVSDGLWSTVRSATTTADGSFVSGLPISTTGTYTFRARMIATSTSAAATSPARVVTIVPKPGANQAFTTTVEPTVSGAMRVGSTLQASPGDWQPTPDGYAYRWLRDGVSISGATSSSYILTSDDAGHHVTVEVRAQRNGTWTARESTTDTPVTFGTLGSLSVTTQGTPSVGSTLTAAVAAGQPQPEGYRYQWTRDGAAIEDATRASYRLVADDEGADVAVHVTGIRPGFTSRTAQSAPVRVGAAGDPQPDDRPTFGDLMHPASTSVVPVTEAVAAVTDQLPPWFAGSRFVRWDTPGAFTHSLDPAPLGSLQAAVNGSGTVRPDYAAEYSAGNPYPKNVDVSFVVTGKRFAIRYITFHKSDAQLWLDGRPVSTQGFAGRDNTGYGSWNWLIVHRASSEPVTVRFAGPNMFSGVDMPIEDGGTVKAAVPRFTLGVVADSYYETPDDSRPYHRTGPIELSTLTGFRVWNMAEAGTGYLNPGTTPATVAPHKRSSRFGSERRIAAIAKAPIDALLVSGSVNDRFWSADEHLAALHQFLDDVAQVRPDLPVVLVGIQPISNTALNDRTYAPFKNQNANYARAAAQHANVVGVIDPYTADWLTGTGHSRAPRGDGNQDLYISGDGLHPNAAGQAYWQKRVAAELTSMKARLTP